MTATQAQAGASTCGALPADLTWLLHRGAQRLRARLDGVAAEHGLRDVRDWVVLGAIIAGPARTQLALATELGLDKTTLMALLDRLEDAGLMVRTHDPCDRRARIPVATDRGRCVHDAVTRARDVAEQEVLRPLTADEQGLLRDLLARLAVDAGPAGCDDVPVTCLGQDAAGQ